VPGLGILLAWFGYSLAYYGFDTITGGNDSFLSLVWPGRYQVIPRDGGSSSPSGSGSKSSGSSITKTMAPSTTTKKPTAGSTAVQKRF
jgi:hypothetical protein